MFGTILLSLSAMISAALVTPTPVNDETNISGHWTFTARIHSQCNFGGTAHLSQINPETYAVELTARQSCAYMDEDYLVRQDCAATQLGNQLSIRCNIKEFVNGNQSEFYYPDNFTLTIASSSRMHGALISAGGFDPAEWTRNEGGIS